MSMMLLPCPGLALDLPCVSNPTPACLCACLVFGLHTNPFSLLLTPFGSNVLGSNVLTDNKDLFAKR